MSTSLSAIMFDVPSGSTVAATGDFLGDGRSQAVFENNGTYFLWQSSSVAGSDGTVVPVDIGSLGTVVGAASYSPGLTALLVENQGTIYEVNLATLETVVADGLGPNPGVQFLGGLGDAAGTLVPVATSVAGVIDAGATLAAAGSYSLYYQPPSENTIASSASGMPRYGIASESDPAYLAIQESGSLVLPGVGSYRLAQGQSIIPNGSGDFFGADVAGTLLQMGSVVTEIMLAGSVVQASFTLGSGESVVAVGGQNADGATELVTESGSTLYGFLLADGTIESATTIGALPAGYTVAATGDFSGTGAADILLMNNSGSAEIISGLSAFYNGSSIFSGDESLLDPATLQNGTLSVADPLIGALSFGYKNGSFQLPGNLSISPTGQKLLTLGGPNYASHESEQSGGISLPQWESNVAYLDELAAYCRANGITVQIETALGWEGNNFGPAQLYQWLEPAIAAGLPIGYIDDNEELPTPFNGGYSTGVYTYVDSGVTMAATGSPIILSGTTIAISNSVATVNSIQIPDSGCVDVGGTIVSLAANGIEIEGVTIDVDADILRYEYDSSAQNLATLESDFTIMATSELQNIAILHAALPNVQIGQWVAGDASPLASSAANGQVYQLWFDTFNQVAAEAGLPGISYTIYDEVYGSGLNPTEDADVASFATLAAGCSLAVEVESYYLGDMNPLLGAAEEELELSQEATLGIAAYQFNGGFSSIPESYAVSQAGSTLNTAAEIAALAPLYQSGAIAATGSVTLTLPTSDQVIIAQGSTVAVQGISVSSASSQALAVVLIDQTGTLSVTGTACSQEILNDGTPFNELVLYGSPAAVTAALTTLTISDPSAGPDTIDVEVFGADGMAAGGTVAVLATNTGSIIGNGTSYSFPLGSAVGLNDVWASSGANVEGGTITTETFVWNAGDGVTSGDIVGGATVQPTQQVVVDQPLLENSITLSGSSISSAASKDAGQEVFGLGEAVAMPLTSTTLTFDNSGSLSTEVDLLAPAGNGGAWSNFSSTGDEYYFANGGTVVTQFNTGDNPNWSDSMYDPEGLVVTEDGSTLELAVGNETPMVIGSISAIEGTFNTITNGITSAVTRVVEINYYGGASDPYDEIEQVFNPFSETPQLWQTIATEDTPQAAGGAPLPVPMNVLEVEYNTGSNPDWSPSFGSGSEYAMSYSLLAANVNASGTPVDLTSMPTGSQSTTTSTSETDNGSSTSQPTSAGSLTLSVYDTTTAQTLPASGQTYSGPVTGILNEFVPSSSISDGLNVTTTTPDWFICTASGNDAINVSQGGGTNVLDGGTGSNFLVGGAGDDTFFLDDRNPSSDIWSTVAGFHSGDNATVWGVTPTDFILTESNNQGAAGYTGLTFTFTAAAQPTADLTLAGYSTSDLTDGSLTVTYGTTPEVAGVPGSSYMLIHAN